MSRLITPIFAGVLVVAIGLGGVLVIDLASFGVAVIAYIVVQVPQPPKVPVEGNRRTNLWQETRFGWCYLMDYTLMGALRNFLIGWV